MRSFHIVLPIDIVQYILKERLVGPARLYVYIQIKYHRRVYVNCEFMKELQGHLRIKDSKTVKKYLAQLVDLNWLGQNGNFYYTRSIDFIHEQSLTSTLNIKLSIYK